MSSYQCDTDSCSRIHVSYQRPLGGSGQCWHETARHRLAWCYGEGLADLITLGADEAAARDLAAWNRLGRRAAA